MTFLSCLTLGAVTLVRDTASVWENQISREATIQIKPADGLDMEAALDDGGAHRQRLRRRHGDAHRRPRGDRAAARAVARRRARTSTNCRCRGWSSSPSTRTTRPISRRCAPMLTPEVPSATLDDHRTWVDRLVAMARTTVTIGMAVLVLMLSATVLSVVFATRGAMAGNGHIIEVLHFVGAEARFIASRVPPAFPDHRHEGRAGRRRRGDRRLHRLFLVVVDAISRRPRPTRRRALFGNFAIGASGYAGVGADRAGDRRADRRDVASDGGRLSRPTSTSSRRTEASACLGRTLRRYCSEF